jgi:HK97 family phage prohead protease
MSRIIRLLDTSISTLGPNRVEAIAGTSRRARDGHVVVMSGMDTSAFLRSGTILWNHDVGSPVGVPVSGQVDSAGNLRLVIDLAAAGTTPVSDDVRRLVKGGIVRNLSIGFDVLEAEPLDKNKPRGGLKITRSELLEVSFVSVPADVNAVVTARAARAGKVLSGANASALRTAHDLAERCRSAIRGVLDAADLDEDTQDIQTSDGTGDSKGSANGRMSADFRRRQAEALALAGAPHSFHRDVSHESRRRQHTLQVFDLQQRKRESYLQRQRDLEALRLAGAAA